MEVSLRNVLSAAAISVIGLAILIFGIIDGQNSWFNLAAVAIIIVGIVGVLNALNILTKSAKTIVVGILVIIWVSLAALDFKSIKDPIDFKEEKNRRAKYGIQRLKDLRQAQFAFKNAKGLYASDAATLINFLKNDSIAVVKAIGSVPDTLTEEKALEMGIISRDTVYVPAETQVYSENYKRDRFEKLPLIIDSIGVVPFSGGQQIEMQAGQIERNKLIVQVFQATISRFNIYAGLDKRLTSLEKDLIVGSMEDPTTNGNWGE